MDAEIEMAFAEFDMGDMDMGQVYDFYSDSTNFFYIKLVY